MPFVPLHLHSEYSLLDGAIRFSALVERAKELRLSSLALTDHGNLYGAIEFYSTCLKAGIKPILGCEMYLAPGGRDERHSAHGLSDAAYHLVLLARDEEGYHNLVKLVTIGFLQGFYYRPRIDKEVLARHARGLIGLSGCLQGEISLLLRKNEYPRALEAVKEYQAMLGSENFYLEVQDHGLPEQALVNREMARLSAESKAPLVATNDSHYLRREDAEAHEVLLCIQTATNMDDPKRMRFEGQEFYLKGEQEMRALFSWAPEAVDNTAKIAERCNFVLPESGLKMPRFSADPAFKPDEYLENLCRAELASRYPSGPAETVARLDRELKVIKQAGFSGYFLIVWDFIRFARSKGIPVGPGRGSAAGSLVSFLLGITALDPLRYGLLFERFLNPERLSPPDIDVDFADNRRDEVIAYVVEKYGRENVAQIITFGTLGARASLRDVGRALNYTFGEVDTVAKLVPAEPDMTLDTALAQVPELSTAVKDNPRIRRLVTLARSLEGLARHASTHAAGVVICPDPLIEHVPLCQVKALAGEEGVMASKDRTAANLMTQYSMGSLEKIGLVKMDFLGLRNLTVIDGAARLIREVHGVDLDPDRLPLDDKAAFDLLGEGDGHGVFQLESSGMRDLLKRLKPRNLEEIIALIALYRPGPMGTIDEFLRRKQGEVPVRYALPELEPILKETYGAVVYQEQVMQIAVAIGGFSLARADLLRRAMSKKDRDAIERQRELFVEGSGKNKVPRPTAEKLFDSLAKFGEYGFNKSHSACYALLAYQTAYLKAHYPREFLCALLTSEIGNAEKVVSTLADCRRRGLKVLPPDINESGREFQLSRDQEDAIRFPLSAVKNVGFGLVDAVAEARKAGGPFGSLRDFLGRVDFKGVTAKAMDSLIKAGALDCVSGESGGRAQMAADLASLMEEAARDSRERDSGQGSLFGGETNGRDEGKPVRVPDWAENAKLGFEKEVLGFYVTGHPLAEHEKDLRCLCGKGLAGLKEMKDGQPVVAGGIILGVKHQVTKRKEAMARVTLEDLEGVAEILVWPSTYAKAQGRLVKESLILVRGRVDSSGDEPKISAEEILTLEEALERLPRKIHLKIAGLDEARLARLRALLSDHPGQVEVFIHTLKANKEITQKLGPKFRLKLTRQVTGQLKEILGDDFWLDCGAGGQAPA